MTSVMGAWQRSRLAELPGQALTQTERDILQLVAAGRSDPDIAQQLGLTLGPVKWALRQLRAKLGARDRAHAVALGCARGLVNLEQVQPGGAP